MTRGRRPAGAARAPDRGTVTAELAIGLVGVVLVLTSVLGVALVGIEQLRVEDAARAGARAAARGEAAGEVEAVARRHAGPSATASQSRSGELVRVRVTSRVRLPLPGRPVVLVDADAAVPVEPGR